MARKARPDIEARVALMRRLGIKRLSLDGIDVELGDEPVPAARQVTDAELAEFLKGAAPDGDDALMWSAPGPLPSELRTSAQPPEE